MRWIVDAMNVIGTRPDGWWKDRHGAMVRLVDQLERFCAPRRETTSRWSSSARRLPIKSPVVEIASAPKAGPNAADDEIVRLPEGGSRPGGDPVVTSDRALRIRPGS